MSRGDYCGTDGEYGNGRAEQWLESKDNKRTRINGWKFNGEKS